MGNDEKSPLNVSNENNQKDTVKKKIKNKNIDTSIKTLKGNITKLGHRLDAIENLDLQNHIIALNEKVDKLAESFKRETLQQENEIHDLIQLVCALKINGDSIKFCTIVNNSLKGNTELITQIMKDASKVKGEIFSSDNPLKLVTGYSKKWSELLKSKGVVFVEF